MNALARGHLDGVPWWFDLAFLGVIVVVGICCAISDRRRK